MQKHTKNGEKQLKLANFETYHGFHRNLFKPVWEKYLKQLKHAQNGKPIDLFTFYCHSINPNNNSTWIFFIDDHAHKYFIGSKYNLCSNLTLIVCISSCFWAHCFWVSQEQKTPENTGKTQNKFDNLLMWTCSRMQCEITHLEHFTRKCWMCEGNVGYLIAFSALHLCAWAWELQFKRRVLYAALNSRTWLQLALLIFHEFLRNNNDLLSYASSGRVV